MLKTYHGSCHCKQVRFSARIDLAKGTGKCNCSFCVKARNWSVLLKPDALRLESGEEALSGYQFNTFSAHHLFCKHCGIRTFTRGDIPEIGGAFVSVSLASLDDLSPDELLAAPVHHADGLHDNWMETPAEIRHL
ncbi:MULTISPECIES: GFA family protein [unclassified Pseudomonas]|uniref:GFA family protein n=1 Tax=unclassified Pseudomonas TaxID=196821 RepID=UPI00244727F1|nr:MULTISPECIES: GFA family protein [unclassified Pseudomonas]MDG9925748.1 GFA family protein [Pseudomonas sp. GD04045]MDH0037424.1 GFA family protein [Pseudomonas sp. GD04019]